MKYCFQLFPPFAFIILLSVLIVLVADSYSVAAFAAASGSPTIDASCSQMQDWGFTAGIVYCVQKSIDSAVTLYVVSMQNALRYYEGMMAAVAIMVFGFKAMNSNIQEPLKETMTLVFRILIGVFFYENAVNIYHWIAGTLPNNDGIMNEAIGWVTGMGSGGGSGNMFSSLISTNCTADNPPIQFEGYQIWQAFDCMFRKILGAASPSAHPYEFATSMLVIVAASLFSATTGVIVAMLGIGLFVNALLLVFRALYLVLMAYVCIGFMTLFAPLIAPMFFFESQYLTEKFKRWAGVIVSCIFQPVMVVGFLAMAIAIDDQLIEGNLGSPGCILPSYPSSAVDSGEPAAGWGQDGSGVCSFTQLFYQGQSGEAGPVLAQMISNMQDQGGTIFHAAAMNDPQSQVNNVTPSSAGYVDSTQLASSGGNKAVNVGDIFLQQAGSIDWNSVTRLKKYAPLKQLMLTILTFIFVTTAMYQLLDVIPAMAERLTTYVGISLASRLKVPFEDGIKRLMSEAEGRSAQYTKGKGLIQLVRGNESKTITKR